MKCEKCTQDLLIHHSYHFESHDNCCRFCKQTWFKLKATTEKELRLLEKDESEYFKTVCPYCDRRFVQAHHVKKHIEFVHEKAPFKCNKCEKSFRTDKALKYHEMVKHKTSSISDVLVCAVCKKTFASEVVLKNHAKYVHSEERKWPCDDCDAKFKQQKDLRVHILRIHNLNQMKEDYQEAEKKKVDIFKCNECER